MSNNLGAAFGAILLTICGAVAIGGLRGRYLFNANQGTTVNLMNYAQKDEVIRALNTFCYENKCAPKDIPANVTIDFEEGHLHHTGKKDENGHMEFVVDRKILYSYTYGQKYGTTSRNAVATETRCMYIDPSLITVNTTPQPQDVPAP